MTWKVPVFDMFYAISQPFLKISTWNFVHIFMRHCPLTYVTVFWKFWFGPHYPSALQADTSPTSYRSVIQADASATLYLPRDIPGNVPLLIILTYPSPRWGLVSYMSCWGGGGKGPPEISQTTRPISEFQMPFDSPVRELPVQGQKFDPEVTDDVTGQVKVRILDFSGLVTSASKISMLSANKADESAWIVSLASVSIISCAVWP